MTRSAPLAVLVVALGALGIRAADAPSQEDPEDRLLRAELLEVSAGDLDDAMKAYRELSADESAPARVRARSLLCLGRCQRKLAQLDQARETLEEVIASYPEERDVVRTARGFLRELQEGRAENPDFDWISEIQRSPEIQARVFDLAMELVDPYTDEARRAAGQLVALGAIAVPVLDRLIETSRDPLHRQRLALIAVESGRRERLDVLLGSGAPARIEYGSARGAFSKVESYLRRVPKLPEAERRRLLEVLDAIEVHPDAEPWAALLWLLAGDRDDAKARLDLVEKEPERLLQANTVEALLEARVDLVAEIAGRILERERPIAAREGYTFALCRANPPVLTSQHWIATIDDLPERDSSAELLIRDALEREDFEVLAAVAPGKAQTVLKLFGRDHGSPQKVKDAPAGWAAVLRELVLQAPVGESELRHMAFRFLKVLALSSDEAARAYVEVLRDRPEGIPSERPNASWAYASVPPPGLAEGLAGVLQEDDPIALALALDTLALAPSGVGPEIVAAVEALLDRAEDPLLRQLALHALLRRLPGRPETGPDVARLLVEEARRTLEDGDEDPSGKSLLPDLRAREWIGFDASAVEGTNRRSSAARISRPLKSEEPPILSARWEPLLVSLQRTGEAWDDVLPILPHLFAIPTSEARNAVIRWLLGATDRARAAEIMVPHIQDGTSPEDLTLLLDVPEGSRGWTTERGTPVAALLETVARDERVPLPARLEAVERAAGYEWLDWARLVREHGELLEALGWPLGARNFVGWLRRLPDESRGPILKAFIESERDDLRRLGIAEFSERSSEFPQVLAAGLEDSAARLTVARRLVEWAERSTAAAPLLVRALAYPELQRDSGVHAALRRLALPETIEPVARLLESPDPTVQELTLESLKSIRATIEERQAWKDVLEQLRGLRREAPKDAKP